MAMHGTLFKYGPGSCNVAFQTAEHEKHVIFVGGLTDGLFACKYVEQLAQELDGAGWSLVQALLSSSYLQYGISSLDKDAHELEVLVQHLKEHNGSQKVVLAGHSTGCQDAVRFVKDFPSCELAGVILQAPVSDREYKELDPATPAMLKCAEDMIAQGRALEVLPREADECAPITAARYQSLFARLGDDDLFSYDFSDNEMRERLGHMTAVPTLVLMSGADEFMPKHVNHVTLAERMVTFMGPNARQVCIEGGDHALSNNTQEAVGHMLAFVSTV